MGVFKDKWGDLTGLSWVLIIIGIVMLIAVGFWGLIAGVNIALSEGVETTITGTIQLHQLKYDKVWNRKYTDCEMRTYSGDTHHICLLGHINLEYGKTYTITYVVRDYWGHISLVNEVVEIVELDG